MSKMIKPTFATISVCMATCNGELYIRRQLDTIIPQLDAGDELVISDDSSNDGTVAIIKEFTDSRIKFFPGQTFRNPSLNFECAVTQASGNIIVLADQDDIWCDSKLAVIREEFRREEKRPYLIMLDAQVVDEQERELYPSVMEKTTAGPGFVKNMIVNRYIGCCIAFSRDLLERALPFPRQVYMHDMWLGQLCERIGQTKFIPIVTMKYRKHGNSTTDFRIKLEPLQQIRRRWFLLWNLVRRAYL